MQYHVKELLKRFRLDGHIAGFRHQLKHPRLHKVASRGFSPLILTANFFNNNNNNRVVIIRYMHLWYQSFM